MISNHHHHHHPYDSSRMEAQLSQLHQEQYKNNMIEPPTSEFRVSSCPFDLSDPNPLNVHQDQIINRLDSEIHHSQNSNRELMSDDENENDEINSHDHQHSSFINSRLIEINHSLLLLPYQESELSETGSVRINDEIKLDKSKMNSNELDHKPSIESELQSQSTISSSKLPINHSIIGRVMDKQQKNNKNNSIINKAPLSSTSRIKNIKPQESLCSSTNEPPTSSELERGFTPTDQDGIITSPSIITCPQTIQSLAGAPLPAIYDLLLQQSTRTSTPSNLIDLQRSGNRNIPPPIIKSRLSDENLIALLGSSHKKRSKLLETERWARETASNSTKSHHSPINPTSLEQAGVVFEFNSLTSPSPPPPPPSEAVFHSAPNSCLVNGPTLIEQGKLMTSEAASINEWLSETNTTQIGNGAPSRHPTIVSSTSTSTSSPHLHPPEIGSGTFIGLEKNQLGSPLQLNSEKDLDDQQLIKARINLQEALSTTPQARNNLFNSITPIPEDVQQIQDLTCSEDSGLSPIKEERTAELAAERSHHHWRNHNYNHGLELVHEENDDYKRSEEEGVFNQPYRRDEYVVPPKSKAEILLEQIESMGDTGEFSDGTVTKNLEQQHNNTQEEITNELTIDRTTSTSSTSNNDNKIHRDIIKSPPPLIRPSEHHQLLKNNSSINPPISIPTHARKPLPMDMLNRNEILEWKLKTGIDDRFALSLKGYNHNINDNNNKRVIGLGGEDRKGLKDRWGNNWGLESHLLSPLSERTERSLTTVASCLSLSTKPSLHSLRSIESNHKRIVGINQRMNEIGIKNNLMMIKSNSSVVNNNNNNNNPIMESLEEKIKRKELKRLKREKRKLNEKIRNENLIEKLERRRKEKEKKEKFLEQKQIILQQLQIDSDNPKLVRDLGILYLSCNAGIAGVKLAIRHLETSLQMNSNDPLAWSSLGKAWAELYKISESDDNKGFKTEETEEERSQQNHNATIGLRKAILNSRTIKEAIKYKIEWAHYLEKFGKWKESLGVLSEVISNEGKKNFIGWSALGFIGLRIGLGFEPLNELGTDDLLQGFQINLIEIPILKELNHPPELNFDDRLKLLEQVGQAFQRSIELINEHLNQQQQTFSTTKDEEIEIDEKKLQAYRTHYYYQLQRLDQVLDQLRVRKSDDYRQVSLPPQELKRPSCPGPSLRHSRSQPELITSDIRNKMEFSPPKVVNLHKASPVGLSGSETAKDSTTSSSIEARLLTARSPELIGIDDSNLDEESDLVQVAQRLILTQEESKEVRLDLISDQGNSQKRGSDLNDLEGIEENSKSCDGSFLVKSPEVSDHLNNHTSISVRNLEPIPYSDSDHILQYDDLDTTNDFSDDQDFRSSRYAQENHARDHGVPPDIQSVVSIVRPSEKQELIGEEGAKEPQENYHPSQLGTRSSSNENYNPNPSRVKEFEDGSCAESLASYHSFKPSSNRGLTPGSIPTSRSVSLDKVNKKTLTPDLNRSMSLLQASSPIPNPILKSESLTLSPLNQTWQTSPPVSLSSHQPAHSVNSHCHPPLEQEQDHVTRTLTPVSHLDIDTQNDQIRDQPLSSSGSVVRPTSPNVFKNIHSITPNTGSAIHHHHHLSDTLPDHHRHSDMLPNHHHFSDALPDHHHSDHLPDHYRERMLAFLELDQTYHSRTQQLRRRLLEVEEEYEKRRKEIILELGINEYIEMNHERAMNQVPNLMTTTPTTTKIEKNSESERFIPLSHRSRSRSTCSQLIGTNCTPMMRMSTGGVNNKSSLLETPCRSIGIKEEEEGNGQAEIALQGIAAILKLANTTTTNTIPN
ncbi:hypothetical protein CROQUDRAFT_713847 [Cronartium quercuum f. sp. fusiforme G11]|uniref:Uncharacterized protein n=1 Tax=Cronartium quercuum f. sp. fusiforme G11 TaxID=708437 RepID=A0A9P6TF51_9BASI|nr:hypothetical protein CROQUDRAFT_713847 [Cronartium quercuum f. sp. fusiforme G11]